MSSKAKSSEPKEKKESMPQSSAGGGGAGAAGVGGGGGGSEEIDLDEIFEIAKKERIIMSQKKVERVEKGLRKANDTLLTKWADDSISNKITALLSSSTTSASAGTVDEIEISFGTFTDKGFVPGVTLREFDRLKKNLMSQFPDANNAHSMTTEHRLDDYRKIVHANGRVEYEHKYRGQENQVDLRDWGIRISGSREEMIPEAKMDHHTKQKLEFGLVRRKNRWSFIIPANSVGGGEAGNPYAGFKIDMTRVDYPHNNSIVYEVELEVLNRESMTPKRMQIAVTLAYIVMQQSRVPIPPKYREIVIRNYNSLFSDNKFMHEASRIYRLENKPLPLNLETLLKGGDYYVTPKFDGERRRLFFDVNGVFIMNDDNTIKQITGSKDAPEFVGTIIDTEYMESLQKYFPFDCLVFEQENLTTKPFDVRKKAFESIKASFIAQKPFFHEDTVFKSIKECFKWMDNHTEFSYDGFIAQPNSDPYKDAATQKWKPLKMMTIDLRVVFDQDGKFFSPYMTTKQGEQIFRGNYNNLPFKYPVHILRQLQSTSSGSGASNGGGGGIESYNGKIVEFAVENGKLKPYRLRDDKDVPNFIATARSTFQLISRPITRDDLLGNTLKIYREYANNVKRQLIERYVPRKSVVLDVGGGRGGDLGKWIDPDAVFSIDVDDNNIREFNKRLETVHNRGAFKIAKIGGEETDKIEEFLGDSRPNVITSFFSLSFFPKSKAKYDGLVATIDRLLVRGGRFVGVTMDGDRTRTKLEGIDSHQIDTSLYTIAQESEFDDNPIGNEITIDLKEKSTMVHKQTEYLVYFDYLVDRLKEIGVKLTESKFLDESMDGMPKVLLDFAHLNRTFVFQRDSGGKPEVLTKKVPFMEQGRPAPTAAPKKDESKEEAYAKEEAEAKKAKAKASVEDADSDDEKEGEEKEGVAGDEAEFGEVPQEKGEKEEGEKEKDEEAVFVPDLSKHHPSLLFGEKKKFQIRRATFERMGVIKGNNSFFHSIYYLLGQNYRESYDKKDRDAVHKYICSQRTAIGKKVTREMFDKLIEGNVAHNIAYDLLFKTKVTNGKGKGKATAKINTTAKAKDEAFEKYKRMVSDCEEWVGSDIALYFAEKMKVNIYIIDIDTKQKIQSSTVEDAKYDIAILFVDQTSYEPLVYVGEEGVRSFRAPAGIFDLESDANK